MKVKVEGYEVTVNNHIDFDCFGEPYSRGRTVRTVIHTSDGYDIIHEGGKIRIEQQDNP